MTSSQPPPNRGYHQSAPSQIYVPVVSLHSNGTYSPKQRIHTHPIRHSAGTGIHLPLPPPTAPPPYPPVMMTIPPPPIHHIGVHPPFSSRPPPPISTSPSVSLNPGGLNHTTNGGIQMPQHVIHQANSSVHIHHGHLVGDGGLTNPLQPPQASSMEPQAYYSHSALAHHHHSIVSEMSPMSSSTHSQDLMSVSAMPYTNGCSGSEADHSEPTADYHDPREHNQNPERNLKNKEKTPMCLINELARHNKTTHQYRLTDESGPSHKKNFIVCLKLGDTEEYLATGPSIKKAQHAAAAMALEKTKLKHPPSKSKQNTKQVPITPTVELNTLAMKRGESAVYTFIDPVRGTPCHGTSHTSTKFVNKKFQNGGGGLASIRVSLKIGDREFIGQASTAQAAKHDAAMNALKVLKNLSVGSSSSVNKTLSSSSLNPKSVPFVPSSSCYSTTTTNGYGSSHHKPPAAATAVVVKEEEEVKSPISLVHESALKRNLVVQFDVTKETGPPHMRKFITTCRCGDFITEGEGNGKKTSKKQAAELMLEQLRQLPPVISCQLPLPTANGRTSKLPRAGSKKAELKKKKAKNLIKMEQKAAPDYGQSINPISRLIQIQQAKKEKEPVYTLIAEKGMPRRREFVMQVTVGNCSAKGSGPNKKLAKRAAAEALLQELGYSPRPPGSGSQPGKPVLKPVGLNLKSGDIDCSNEANTVKKLTFSDEAKSSLANTPGIIILPTSNDIQAYSDSNVDVSSSSNSVNPRDSNHNNRTEKNIQSILSPKRQLSSLAEVLGLKVTYRHINKRDKNDNFVSLVKLTTTPPKVFYGSGNSLEMSEVDAAAKALLAIADSGIDEDPEQTC